MRGRVVAVTLALAMVLVAVLARALVSDGDDGGGGSGGEPVDLLCATELTAVCTALDEAGVARTSVEPAGDTLARLQDPEGALGADGWLTLAPYPEMVDDARAAAVQDTVLGEGAPTGGSSALAIAAFEDRAAALEADCGEVTWACLGDAAGEPWTEHSGDEEWGEVTPGYDAPDRSATGLLVLAQAVADHLDLPDFALNDLTPEVSRWLRDLEDAVGNRPPGSALDAMVLRGPAAFSAVGDLDVAATQAQDSRRGEGLRIFYPAPMFRAEVVLAPARGRDLGDLAGSDELATALDEAGWEHDVAGEPLPDAGALLALLDLWADVA